MNTQATTRPVEFYGTGREYFGIWIVNLLLSLVTLGIYSAWAKVRRKKYFYNNTLIDQVGFDYHANPISILKGRAIALIFFLLYFLGNYIHAAVPPAMAILFFIALPWLIVRASIFNARNSSHRGLRFDFDGTLGEAFKAYFLLPVLTIFSLGLATPYVSRQQHKFLIDHHKYASSRFDMQATTGEFYAVYLKFLGIFLLISVISSAIIFGLGKAYLPSGFNLTPGVAKLLEDSKQAQDISQQSGSAETLHEPGTAELSADQIPPEGDQTGSPEAEQADDSKPGTAKLDPKLEKIFKNPLIVLGFLIPYLLFILGVVSYFQARIGNLIWNSATLDKLAFTSTLRFRDLLWIHISNFLAILLTFGLATPWAQIRAIKYLTSKLAVVGVSDLTSFVGEKKAEAQAAGEEIADMFDIDISFG